ncbi:metal ABC transporter substrate-binding protein [Rickettsiales endosymbiont of Stachyamoeba lipophora]|uniref:metal ABC transporter substrate-binding protein n=1 Tax=Rickettsiales endosymbiont of Stachyamoeba lipophora TaxID=2486578 RepID=UPI000F64B6E1|nr:metal ABC transporter substrate-binding protein [Rickettsiales endosymbiont of Stachyamoeba lipophora]AZL15245.1 hypothetical protein EF513_01555 [Rickettsiales endosymbiont of Stachyamoeba lipophora]
MSIFFKNFILSLFVILTIFNTSASAQAYVGPKIKIITTIRPIAGIVQDIAKEYVQVDYLVRPNQDPHNYTLLVGDLRRITDSDKMIIVGEEFEPNLAKYIKVKPSDKVLNLSKIEKIKLLDQRHDCKGHHHGKKHEHSADGHYWLDVSNAQIIAEAIAQVIIKQIPNAEQAIKANLAAFKQDLEGIKANFEQTHLNKDKQYFITHDSLQYLEKDLGLTLVDTLFSNHYQQVSLSRIKKLTDKVKQNKVKCALMEVEFNTNKTNEIYKKIGLVPTLLEMENVEINNQKNYISENSYVKMLNNVLTRISDCLL